MAQTDSIPAMPGWNLNHAQEPTESFGLPIRFGVLGENSFSPAPMVALASARLAVSVGWSCAASNSGLSSELEELNLLTVMDDLL